MLQKVEFDSEFIDQQEDRGYLLQPAYYWQLIKRRWAAFFIPFVLITSAGVGLVMLWPPTYLSEGKILVQSQQIPTELVRPTVTSAAQERIQVIEQRTMTRDILVAIADKFQLFPDKRQFMSDTELVERMKKNTLIEPVNLDLDFKQRVRTDNPTTIFSVGFEYSDPDTAARVANELVTRILNEDLRDRTSRASETTKFLARDVQKLQADNAVLDSKIAQLKDAQGVSTTAGGTDKPTLLSQLKAELVEKSAIYSDRHPFIQTLKRQIAALEKDASAKAGSTPAGPDPQTNNPAVSASLDQLTAQQEALQKNLDVATAKLNAARLGESLEKDQQSEKLEVIEQPTTPQNPVKPKRLKLSVFAVAAAFMAGVGLTFLREMTDEGIRRSSDIFRVVDSQLVLSIPYITTVKELRQKKRRIVLWLFGLFLILVMAGIAVDLFLPPLDLLFAKARVGLFR
jgi:uncharacterized protein involved in exopolysaccharide biosynthesis